MNYKKLKKANNPPKLRTSAEWYDIVYPKKEVVILDPDGWDRSNYHFSYNEELITQEVFEGRVMRSTCLWNTTQ